MRRIISWFVHNPVAANLLMAVLIVGGLLSLSNTRQEEFPNVDFEMLMINVPYRGAIPEEVEIGVCVRVEEALEGAENVKRMSSTSSEGNCRVSLEYGAGTDMVRALNEIKGKVDAINTFPVETEKPIISQVTVVSQAVDIAIYGDTDERSLKTIAQQMRDDIAAIDGISQVSMSYVRPDEVSIEISEQALRRYGLTLNSIADSIRRSSLDLPGGSIRTESGEVQVRTQGQMYVGREFEDIVVVTAADGTAVRLGEIGRVVDGFAEGDLRVRYNGQPASMVKVYRTGAEDTIDIVEKVRAYVDQAEARLPTGISVDVWHDNAQDLAARLDVLLATAIGGLAMVLMVLALPLRFRVAMWVAAGIPIAMLGTMMTFGALGVTLSTLTVMGFILVLGIVVDDAIVVGERIYAHERDDESQLVAAVNGTHEVAVPVIFGVLTTVAAFVPIIFIPGRIGAFFSVIGVVVCACLVFSIIESMMILPAHLAHRKRTRDTNPRPMTKRWLNFQNRVETGLMRFAREVYGGSLKKVLEWRYTALAIAFGIIIITIGFFASGRLGFQFFPPIEGNRVVASVQMPLGINVEQTMAATDLIEQSANKLVAELSEQYPEEANPVAAMLTSVGVRAGRVGGPQSNASGQRPVSHEGEVVLKLLPFRDREHISATEIENRWRALTGPITGAVELKFSADLFSAGDPISIQLRGRNVDALREAATEIRTELARFGGVFDITDSFRSGKQEAKLSLRPEGRSLGLTLNDLGTQVRQAFFGAEAQRIQRGSEDLRIMVRFPESERRSLGDLEEMRIRLKDGTEVPFAAVANVDYGIGFSNIRRVDGRRVITVTANVDREIVTPEEVLAAVEQTTLPQVLAGYPSIDYSLTGEREDHGDAMAGMGDLIPVALLVIYAILAIPLHSYWQPFVIMSVIPFGTIGAVVGHVILGFPIVMPSMLGIIALSGVVVNSSLVMVDYINRQRLKGEDLREAVLAAGIVRFRPILLTSITTFVGLLPLMMNRNMEIMFIVPMAISLAWGVLFATFITLYLVPSLYLIIEDIVPWRAPGKDKSNTSESSYGAGSAAALSSPERPLS